MHDTRWLMLMGVVVALLSFAVLVGACGDDEKEAEKVTPTTTEEAAEDETSAEGAISVELAEFSITADPDTAAAGTVTFDVSNLGEEAHEFMVIDTDLAPDELPALDDGSVDESQVTVVDEIEETELAAGSSADLDVDLEAGDYVLICNLVEEHEGQTESHYEEGMFSVFEVTE